MKPRTIAELLKLKPEDEITEAECSVLNSYHINLIRSNIQNRVSIAKQAKIDAKKKAKEDKIKAKQNANLILWNIQNRKNNEEQNRNNKAKQNA